MVSTFGVKVPSPSHFTGCPDWSSTPTKTDAEVTKQADGTATISATLASGATNGSDLTIIYPATAADGTTGKVLANLLTAQDGTLATIATNYDVRKGTGKLSISGGKATVNNGTAGTTVALTNQFAIWKLTLGNDAKNLCIMADNVPIAGATLASAGKEFTVAIPAVSSKKNVTITIVANDESNNCYYFSKYGVKIVAGNYYQSAPTMKTLGTSDSESVYKITGDAFGTIGIKKTVVLSGVNITNGSITCFENDDATIILMGTNTVTADGDFAAIRVGGTRTTLTNTGTGSLTATGGDSGAGIGTDSSSGGNVTGGNIVINGGTVTATGSIGSAGIGTGYVSHGSNTCGAITIGTGVTSVIATKGLDCFNSIGPGYASTPHTQHCGTITFGTKQVFDGTTWSSLMKAGTYGGLNLAITTTTRTDDTWTLTPAP